MKNWEKFEDEIKKVGLDFGITVNGNRFFECANFGYGCNECMFGKASRWDKSLSCAEAKNHWLYNEDPKVDWKNVKVDSKVIVSLNIGDRKIKRYFKSYDEEKHQVYLYDNGGTSWSSNGASPWDENDCELA